MPIQFSDDLEVNEITRHTRSELDDLFWEDDEIAEFRHHAFLVACGLATDDEDEEDEIVSLEGFELMEEEKDVVTQMHSSLPVIAIDFDILESKQKCLKKTAQVVVDQVQEKPKPVKQPKIKNRISNLSTTKRISKFQDLIDRQRSGGTLASTTNSPFSATGKKPVQRSPVRKAAPFDQNLEKREKKAEEPEIDDSRRKISIEDRLRLWKERDEVSRQSLDSSDCPPIDIPPPPMKFLETSSPHVRRPLVDQKKIRKSTRTPRPAPLDLDNSDHPSIDLSSRSQTPLDESSPLKLDSSQRSVVDAAQRHALEPSQHSQQIATPQGMDSNTVELSPNGTQKNRISRSNSPKPRKAGSQRSGLDVTHVLETSQQSQQSASHQGMDSNMVELSPSETQKKRTSRSKSPKPGKDGVGTTKSHDTPRSGRKKLAQQAANFDTETPRQSNSTTSDDMSEVIVDPPSSLDETPRSRKKKVSKATKKVKSLSLSSVDTTSTQSTEIAASSDDTPRSRKNKTSEVKTKKKSLSLSSVETSSMESAEVPTKSPKPSISSDELVAPKTSRKSSSSQSPSFSLLETDSLPSMQEDSTKKNKKRSSKAVKTGENEQSLEAERSHSNIEPPKSPKRPSSTSKKTLEPASPRLSKRTSCPNKAETSDVNRDGLASKLNLKGSKYEEINNASSPHSDEIFVGKKSPSATKKNHKSEQEGEESRKSRQLHCSDTVPTTRRSLPVPLCPTPTVTVTIRKGKKKEEASNVRRKVVRRSLSSCLEVKPHDFEWRQTVKRSNSVKMPKVIS